MYLNNFRIYLREVQKLRNGYPQCFDFFKILKFFPAWHSSLNGKANPLTDEQPWITFAAIDFLKQILTKDMRVFEYGSGGSTLFFAKRVKEVISVEHDRIWSEKVIGSVKKDNCENVRLNLIEPTKNAYASEKKSSDPDSYVSDSDIYLGYCFKDYAKYIDKYPDGFFDLISIDGRSRPSCLKHSINKVNKNGYILLDNAERNYYFYIHDIMKNINCLSYNFYGPGPYNSYFWQTCIWRKI